MYICPFSFYCTHKVLYLYQYFMTTISECFSTVSNGCMLSHWKWLTFYILKCLLYTDDYLLFVHVLYMLLCDDRASCKTACGWWVILYKYVLIKKIKKYWPLGEMLHFTTLNRCIPLFWWLLYEGKVLIYYKQYYSLLALLETSVVCIRMSDIPLMVIGLMDCHIA